MARITITAEELQEWESLESEISELQRRARALGSKRDQIKSKAMEQLQAAGKTAVKRLGFNITIAFGRASVAWKDAFVREVGAEAAAKLQAEARVTETIKLTRA